MKNLYTIVLLATVLAVSGCVGAEKVAQEEVAQKVPAENITEKENVTAEQPAAAEEKKEEAPKAEVPKEETKEPETPKVPKLVDEKLVITGSNPVITEHKNKLWIAYQKYGGISEDIYARSFDGKIFDSGMLVSSSTVDDMQPAIISYLGNLYVFFTQTIPRSQTATLFYSIYDGKIWSNATIVSDLDLIYYYHNSSALQTADGNVLLFWTKGKPSDYGFISSRLLKRDYWIDGVTLTVAAAVTDDKNPKVISVGKNIYVLYDNFAPNGGKNEVYIKKYTSDNVWESAIKLTEDSESLYKSAGSLAYFNEKFYVVWVEKGDFYLRASNDGLLWDKTIRLTSTNAVEEEPSLASFNGTLYMAYTKYNNNAPFVYLAKLDV